MLKYIAGRFKRHRVKGIIIKDERSLLFHNLETAKRCTLFWVADDIPLVSVERIRKTLAEHMEVSLLGFVRHAKNVAERDENALYVDEGSISYGGKWNDLKLKEVLEREDDLFIDLSLKSDVLSDYMVKYARSHCKVGVERDGGEYDINLAGVQNIDDFVSRLFGLLTKINTY